MLKKSVIKALLVSSVVIIKKSFDLDIKLTRKISLIAILILKFIILYINSINNNSKLQTIYFNTKLFDYGDRFYKKIIWQII